MHYIEVPQHSVHCLQAEVGVVVYGPARADYRHIFDSNETSDSWRYDATLSRQKNGIRTFISLPKNVLERQRKEIFGVKTRPLARDGLCTEEMAVCGQLGTGG